MAEWGLGRRRGKQILRRDREIVVKMGRRSERERGGQELSARPTLRNRGWGTLRDFEKIANDETVAFDPSGIVKEKATRRYGRNDNEAKPRRARYIVPLRRKNDREENVDYGARMSLRVGLTWMAARLEASQPPPSALTRRTLVTSFWPWRMASSCSLLRRFCWALTTSR